MKNMIVVSISEDATVRFLVNEDTKALVTEDAIVRRASHVEPVNPTLRKIFHTLRAYFGDKGWMAAFTRRWSCLWRINLKPTGGPILPFYYRDRQQAITQEIEYLNQNFI